MEKEYRDIIIRAIMPQLYLWQAWEDACMRIQRQPNQDPSRGKEDRWEDEKENHPQPSQS